MLTVEELRAAVAAGSVEDVIVAVPDLQGRLQGSRLAAQHFLDTALRDGFPACSYLLAADVDMQCDMEERADSGYAIDPWATGFGDFVLRPDLDTLRLLPWDEGTACVLADAVWQGSGSPVAVAPRHVLRGQLDRLAERGLQALAGTELEFLVFTDSYQQAHERDYARLRPASRHNVDYALTGLAELEPVVRRIKRMMAAAGLTVETARAECHPGQYEIVFRYAGALTTCDNHVLYKTGAKQIAAAEGVALTFMAKYDEGEGNSCHLHLSLRATDGTPVFAGDGRSRTGMSPLMEHFVGGQLACLADFTLLYAPTVNSYKRLQPGSFAPTGIAWGRDNRTCPIRVVGSGAGLRIEHRVPGGDANPYLAVAAAVAAGLHGIEHELPLPPACTGNAFAAADVPRLPATLREAVSRWERSPLARKAFGDDVVDHYAHAARVELTAFDAAVTDWERIRNFERL